MKSMIDRMGWLELGISSSQMSWLIITEILAAFVVPTLGVFAYYIRLSRAIDRMPAEIKMNVFENTRKAA